MTTTASFLVGYRLPRRDWSRDRIRMKVGWALERFDREYPGKRLKDQTKVWFASLGLFNPVTTHAVRIRVKCQCDGERNVQEMYRELQGAIDFHFRYE